MSKDEEINYLKNMVKILSNRLVLTLLCVAFSGTFAVAFIGNDESKHRYLNLFQILIF